MSKEFYLIDGTMSFDTQTLKDNNFILVIYGNLSKAHNFHTQTENSFAQAIKMAAQASTYKTLKGAITPITRSNRHILAEIPALLRKLNITQWILTPIDLQSAGTDLAGLSARFSIASHNITEAVKQATNHGIETSAINFPLCAVPIGKSTDQTPKWIEGIQFYNLPKLPPLIQPALYYPTKCDNCKLKPKCPGFQQSYIKFFSDEEMIPQSD